MLDEKTKIVIEQTANSAAKNAVEGMLVSLGIDATDPIEVQKDMAYLREFRQFLGDPEVQADLLHMRKWRKTMEGVQRKSLVSVVGLIVVGTAALIWMGIQAGIHKL